MVVESTANHSATNDLQCMKGSFLNWIRDKTLGYEESNTTIALGSIRGVTPVGVTPVNLGSLPTVAFKVVTRQIKWSTHHFVVVNAVDVGSSS